MGGGWAGSDENQMLERFRVGPYLKIHPFPPKETEGPVEVDVRPLSLSATAHAPGGAAGVAVGGRSPVCLGEVRVVRVNHSGSRKLSLPRLGIHRCII